MDENKNISHGKLRLDPSQLECGGMANNFLTN